VVISGAYLLSSEFLLKKGLDPMLKNWELIKLYLFKMK
jgi:hypothetical protein